MRNQGMKKHMDELVNRKGMSESERSHIHSRHPIKDNDELLLLKQYYTNNWRMNQVVKVNML